MITQKQLEILAAEAGYEEPGDYACDHDLWRCDYCGLWGLWGDDVVMEPEPGIDYVCQKCYPDNQTLVPRGNHPSAEPLYYPPGVSIDDAPAPF